MTVENNYKLGLVLLAAGQASRMGMPKQLLVYKKEVLIRRVIEKLLKLEHPLTVVLGARAALIRPVLHDLDVDIVENTSWQQGMGSSLKLGLSRHLDKTAVLFCLVDQPFLSSSVLQAFMKKFSELTDKENGIIAAKYENGQLGVPALFGSGWFEKLAGLSDKEGARHLLQLKKAEIEMIDFPKGLFDLDSPEDWNKFRKK